MKLSAVIGLLAAVPSAFAIWPIPQTLEQGNSNTQAYWVNINVQGYSGNIVNNAVNRYRDIINRENFLAPVDYKRGILKPNGSLQGLTVSVESTDETLGIDTDESYTLDVPVDGQAMLNAKTPYGALRGLETFSQLISTNGNAKVIANTPVHIKDAPVYTHRGLLFDSARNYYSLASIYRTLDAMSYNKMNVFHWHIVDAQSWPVESRTFPDLQKNGAYSAQQTYSYNDVNNVIAYAKERGIRVIPEFDVPGHTYIVGLAKPDIMSCLNVQPNWADEAAEPPSGQLNIANPDSIDFANKIVDEYTKLFTDQVYHLGGDEVNRNCWNNDPTIQTYLATHPGESVESLLANFYTQTHNHLETTGKTAYTWEETLFHSNYVPSTNNTILQVWIDQTSVQKAVALGYRVVSSSSDAYYLDCGHGAWLPNFDGNSWCDPFKTWMHIYNYDVAANITDAGQKKLILGTEVAAWSEQIDETVIDPRLWPRASAMAETAWSGKTASDGHVRTTAEVASRLHEQRFRMVGRGINAEPMQPLWCARNPGSCNLPPS
ncbi:Glucosamine-6-phosphate isomerase (Glucosamine-6-phosphate deaminase) (GNPDA) (GlcN6P deaminase) [Coemansia spiralis]|uniref:Beta-hexosaminidase n=2 Tax=Coemansia TaxID=4863 RepID=A0A9W8G5M6_9FUNG|nr:Glucosamine-6-phosphate isomerase (Glucosamine-6-phosphate deaminase) (GNPDA) (GlcN6P deaminase) [Coemansia umbellata]KAJ2620333.1 Glucosamine-6-phosphate isomerase (Glucosamine-6-phosphate deaminase) (GNPDA) (GlcN6P deaminase) [Coemansia sp. RSA 1358]KAJ2672808.1 Glucosamine-6-phosphate isomerase (Glucosamine-6-phosphate deaminase) (GNPDA) (GlcN6P deaminase) [Coemansia spiralis]